MPDVNDERATVASSKPNWRSRAACRGADPELFFPEGAAGPAQESVALAKRICSECEVRAHCLDWAVRHCAAFGVWGGRTEQERRAHRSGLLSLSRRKPAM
jgi:WhiB family transcriptional regulator, redox-sensing transcriptional regulator